MVDDGKEDDDSEGDEEEFEDGVHPSPLTANLVSEGCFFIVIKPCKPTIVLMD